MNISTPFIRRPIGTTLLALGLFLAGAVAYRFLPVASLPNIELPVVHVQASEPGADPETMAATVAAPLERRIGEIAGVNELTSVSSLGSTSISAQFDLSRSVDNAARDVEAAINAAGTDLPADLPSQPVVRKFNSAAAPIMILALTSDTLSSGALYDAADTVIAQRIAQVDGVANVAVNGAEQPAVRVRVDPSRLAAMGIGLDAVRTAIANANVEAPLGSFEGPDHSETIALNDQMRSPDDYRTIIVRAADGTAVPLGDVASVTEGPLNDLMAGWYGQKPSVLLIITKQADANVIDTVDGIQRLLPQLKEWVPAGIRISVLMDRTGTIRASIEDLQLTMAITVALVMMVVFLFLRRLPPTLAAGITVPLSLAGTVAGMWAAGFALDNLSLMALIISVGFVVDDAIVMIENAYRNLETGLSPMEAALRGARQIGFTVVSISLSLIAAFIPLLFMGGIAGRLFREFSVTLTMAIALSALVSLTVTPMICGNFMRRPAPVPEGGDRLGHLRDAYRRSLVWALGHSRIMMMVMLATVAATVWLFIAVPKGFFPQDDTGVIMAITDAPPATSFDTMKRLQTRVGAIIGRDPDVVGFGSFIGTSGGPGNASGNQGRMFITLKPLDQRKESAFAIAARLRRELAPVAGINVFLVPISDLRAGGRTSKAEYQFTLWDTDIAELTRVVPRVLDRIRAEPGFRDVSTDREQGGLQAQVTIDRTAAARRGVSVTNIDAALNDAFAQRQVSTIHAERNQYHVVLGVAQPFQLDPADLSRIYVTASDGGQVPLSAVAHVTRTLAPLVVNHQGQFPSVTITYNLAQGVSLGTAAARINDAIGGLHLPDSVHTTFAGNALLFQATASQEPLLIAAALAAIYIVLGVLYESLLHPITILSTLPSAGLGALSALFISGTDLTLIALIGIILLIGIVKKNGIMLVDFALEAERTLGLEPRDAILQACLVRFRPIMMTTLTALLGALPLCLVSGAGSELRQPLGITIVGGLVVSQLLTLYTTPVVYMLMDRLRPEARRARRTGPAGQPA